MGRKIQVLRALDFPSVRMIPLERPLSAGARRSFAMGVDLLWPLVHLGTYSHQTSLTGLSDWVYQLI